MIDSLTIRNRFLHALKLGIGEAYLLMQEHPEVDFSREIIAGAVQNFALDAQSEGSRADYIYGLIKRSATTDLLIIEVLERLLYHQEDDWGLYQLFDLAVLIHRDGYPEALPAIYERFAKSRQDDYECSGNPNRKQGAQQKNPKRVKI